MLIKTTKIILIHKYLSKKIVITKECVIEGNGVGDFTALKTIIENDKCLIEHSLIDIQHLSSTVFIRAIHTLCNTN